MHRLINSISDQMDFKQEILTAADDLDKGYITADKKTGDDNSKPMFVHVQTLTKGQAFVSIISTTAVTPWRVVLYC